MPRRDAKQFAGDETRRPAQAEDGGRIVHPRCITNGAYKYWHPSVEEETAVTATPAASVAQGHASWLARLRFSFFHR
jgi:hypothetical protein